MPPAEWLTGLNAQQRRAVTHPGGPLLVVAGPGTGKTQVLAARAAWLTQQPDGPRPGEVLCLTYTEAAARNMRQRLLDLLGPTGHEVAVYTFHGFGQLVLEENADRLGLAELAVASEAETRQFYLDLLDELRPGHPLRRDTGDPYYEAQRLAPTFRLLKEEGWDGPQWVAALQAYEQGLPRQPAYQYKRANKPRGIKEGDPHPQRIADESARIRLSQAAAELFAPFQDRWRQARRYDYQDMLQWGTGLLRDHAGLREHYQERYPYVLVDEYQDTNGAQNQLLWLVAGEGDEAQVLAVGDDDQSVFRFQGACLANLQAFTERYPAAAVVVLEENYRSSAHILRAAAGLIGRNQERLCVRQPEISKLLLARHARFCSSAVLPVLRRYASAWHEAAHVVAEVAEAMEQSTGTCAVLAHHRHQLDVVARLLAARGVPFYRKQQLNVLREEALATSLHRALSYVAEALRPVPALSAPALFAVLHLECFAMPPADVVRLAASYQAQFSEGNAAWPWYEWLEMAATDVETADDLRLSVEGRQALVAALARLTSWLQAAASRSVVAVVELILLETLLPWQLTHVASPGHQHAVARTLRSFVEAEAQRQPRLTCTSLLAAWDTLAATLTGLPLERTIGSERTRIHLSTVHSAKGLEFERVWLLGCQQNVWLRTSPPKHYVAPPALATGATVSSEEEARRLFFVALTRAQEHLVISCTDHDFEAKELIECRFFTELADDGWIVERPVVTDEAVAQAQAWLNTPAPPAVPLPGSAVLDKLLTGFTLSITTLNAYLACPVRFYYEHLLQAPLVESETRAFGKAMHKALEWYFEAAQAQEIPAFGPADSLATLFDTALAYYRPILSPTAYARRQETGRRWLLAYHAHFQSTWSGPAVAEHHVTLAQLPGGIPLTGILDRLDPQANGTHLLVDYKTGNPTNAPTYLKPASSAATTLAEWHHDAKARGGDYWRQAVFYHLLLKHDVAQRFRPNGMSFHFLQPSPADTPAPPYAPQALQVTPDDETTVLAQITAVDAAIRAHDFEHSCGSCYWCQLRQASSTT